MKKGFAKCLKTIPPIRRLSKHLCIENTFAEMVKQTIYSKKNAQNHVRRNIFVSASSI